MLNDVLKIKKTLLENKTQNQTASASVTTFTSGLSINLSAIGAMIIKDDTNATLFNVDKTTINIYKPLITNGQSIKR